MRRRLIALAPVLAATALLAACGGSGDDDTGSASGSTKAASKEPLRVAVLPISGGPLGQFGADGLAAIELAAEQANAKGGVAGHKVEIVTVETNGTPPQTVRAAQKAVSQHGAKIITGVLSSPEQGALQPQLARLGALSIMRPTDDVLTGKNCSPNAFRISQSDAMAVATLANTLGDKLNQKWAIQAVDFSSGHTAAENFKKAVEKAGGEVVLEQYAAIGTTEFGSFITKLKASKADALFAAEYGADAVAFINQADQFKLFDKFKTVVGSNMLSEPLFKPLGNKIAGFYNDLRYSTAVDTPSNAEFVKAWKAKHETDPYYIPAGNYVGMQVLFAAVEKAQSTDVEKIKQALPGLTVDTLLGQATMRPEDHQLLLDTFLGKVVEKDGGLTWEVVGKADPATTTPSPSPDCQL
jgi:ABC-type branched-subunit amino acid transport system substrate-binding protein